MEYIPRLLDVYLEELSGVFAACAIDGPKFVGKTATASRLVAGIVGLDQQAQIEAFREDPQRLALLPRPLLIDEWQLYPPVWDLVRRAVDEGAGPGSFFLTGSATPQEAPRHSGAGRIIHVRMRPFSLFERNIDQASVSLAALLTGDQPSITGATSATAHTYAEEIVRGGFPKLREVPDKFRAVMWDGYLTEVFDKDLPELGRPVRRGEALKNWLRAYGAATATMASYTDILDNASPNDADKPSKPTTIAWREMLARMWLLDPLPAYSDSRHRLGRLSSAAKHHLADPALACHLLGLSAETLLMKPDPTSMSIPRVGTFFGALFESLVVLSVRVYAELAGVQASHLRTRSGDHEVDLMLTRPDGKVVAIEVKSSPTVDNRDTKHLCWLRDVVGDDLLDLVIINTGPAAYRRSEDQVAVIPAVLLGP